MFPQPILAPWARLFASLAVEVILVIALTALLARLIRPASGQRMVWRGSFVVIAALVLAEFSGLGHSLLQNLRASTPATPPVPHTLVTTVVTLDTLAAPAWAPPAAKVPVVPAVKPHENLWSTLALWLPGLALAGLVWLVLRRSFGALKLILLERQASPDSGDLAARVEALGRRLGIRRRVRVKSIAGLSSPIAFGMFRPTIGAPGDFSIRFTAAQQDAMLAHELAHVAAFDAAWMLLADLVTALLWWHPAAWWARRQLRATSETAADEASLLLEDGPATLAECLVTLGDLLTRSPDPGGLGMAGFRFRSELGRRVERLLHLRDGARHPWRGTTAWLARLLVPATLLALALAVTAWLLPPAASAATIGEAFQSSPLGLATTALLTAEKYDAPGPTYKGKMGKQLHDLEKTREAVTNDVRRLLLLGKKIYDAGSTNEAETTWRKVLELDSGNKVALDYLARIGRTNSQVAKPAVLLSDTPLFKKLYNTGNTNEAKATRPSTHTNFVYTSNARQKIYQRLNSIRLESVMFDGVPLTQALEQIRKEAKRRDPDQKGINIIVSSTADPQAAAPAIDPATGLPVDGFESIRQPSREQPAIDPTTGLPMASGQGDANATTVTINPAVNDVTLGQVLDILVKVASRPIRYSVEDYGVLFTSGGPGNPPLHTRWFKVDPNTFLKGLKGATWPNVERWQDFEKWLDATRTTGQGNKGGDFLTTPTPLDIVSDSARAYFRTKGANLDPPRSLIFNDRLGMLMVRATLADLDVIEQAVQVLNTAPPQVVIEVKFCEVPEELLSAPGLKLRPSMTATNGAVTSADRTTLTSILTPDQSRDIFQALERRQDVSILARPRVTTPTGRQAQLKTVEVRTLVTGLDLSTNLPAEPGKPAEHPFFTETFEFGPVVDVVPSVAPDRQAIIMTVVAGLKEFAGYDRDGADELWDKFEFEGGNPAQKRPADSQKPPRPVLRDRQAITIGATVWDGQTLVLASRNMTLTSIRKKRQSELPDALARDLFRRGFGAKDSLKRGAAKSDRQPGESARAPKAVLVFVTPTIVDPAGNPVHTDADIPARTNSMPAQLPQTR